MTNMTIRKFSLLCMLSVVLPGCNTMEGFGTDVKYVGQSLEEVAEETKAPSCCICPTCGRSSCVHPQPPKAGRR